MPKANPVLAVEPVAITPGTPWTLTFLGTGFRRRSKINIGGVGETSWSDNVGVWVTAETDARGNFEATYTRAFPYPGVQEIQARHSGTDPDVAPDVLASAYLRIAS